MKQIEYNVLYKKTFPSSEEEGEIIVRLYLLNGKPMLVFNKQETAVGVQLDSEDLVELGKALVKAWEQKA